MPKVKIQKPVKPHKPSPYTDSLILGHPGYDSRMAKKIAKVLGMTATNHGKIFDDVQHLFFGEEAPLALQLHCENPTCAKPIFSVAISIKDQDYKKRLIDYQAALDRYSQEELEYRQAVLNFEKIEQEKRLAAIAEEMQFVQRQIKTA